LTAYGNTSLLLATDIADCMEQATSRTDFHHLLDVRGIEADIGETSTLFTIRAGTYGLTKEMACGDKKLQAYGDFSATALEKHFADMPTLQIMMDNLADNPSLLFDALYDIGQKLGISQDDLYDRFHSRSLTPLEGWALKEWILKHKDKAFETDHHSIWSGSHKYENGYEM